MFWLVEFFWKVSDHVFVCYGYQFCWQWICFCLIIWPDSIWTVILSRKVLSKILWIDCKTFKEALWMKICPFMEIFLSAIMFLNVLLDTTLSDKVCQWLATGRWFFLCTLVFSNNKANCHDIAELLLKVALNTITYPIYIYMYTQHFSFSFSNISSLL
jgi:hypothetical protein